MPPEVKDLLSRYDELVGNRGTWEAHWQEIADYGVGRREFTTQTIDKGRKRTKQIFDQSFMHAGGMLAAGLESLISNPATRWFRLKLEDDRLMEMEEVAFWVSLAEKQMYNAFNRPEAGFSAAQHEAYHDIVFFGTGGVFVEDGGDRGPIFMAAPLSGLYLGENEEQRLDTYMWLRHLNAKQVQQKYGVGASEKADKMIEKGNFEEELDILRIVMPRTDPQLRSLRATNMPWASYHIAIEESAMLQESGYPENPFAVARWDKDSGETYGRGPGIQALIPQKVLNEERKTLLVAGQKRVHPPLVVPSDGVVQALQTEPGGVTVVKAAYMQGGKAPVFPLDAGTNIPIGMEIIDRDQRDVRTAFHWELLQLVQHVPGTTPPTATHISQLASNQQRVIAPILGRLQNELPEAEVERVFGIEMRAGRMPPVPAVLAGQKINVEFVSPAARAQRTQDAMAVRSFMATVIEVGQVDPMALKLMDVGEGLRVIAEAEGVPVGVVRSRADVQQILEAEQRLAAEQAQMERAAQQAEIASKVTPALQAIQGGKAA